MTVWLEVTGHLKWIGGLCVFMQSSVSLCLSVRTVKPSFVGQRTNILLERKTSQNCINEGLLLSAEENDAYFVGWIAPSERCYLSYTTVWDEVNSKQLLHFATHFIFVKLYISEWDWIFTEIKVYFILQELEKNWRFVPEWVGFWLFLNRHWLLVLLCGFEVFDKLLSDAF